jgi:hypothetical protein
MDVRGLDRELVRKKREPDPRAELYRGLQDLQSGRKFSKREEL